MFTCWACPDGASTSFFKKKCISPPHVLILDSGKRKKKGTEMEQIDCTPPEHILPGSKERPLCPLQPQNRDWKVTSIGLQAGKLVVTSSTCFRNACFHSPVPSRIRPTFQSSMPRKPTKRQALLGQKHRGYFLYKFFLPNPHLFLVAAVILPTSHPRGKKKSGFYCRTKDPKCVSWKYYGLTIF